MGRWPLGTTLPSLVLALVLTACDRDATGPRAGATDLTGTVARLKTGAGVPNLVVALLEADRVVTAANTDEAGMFTFPGVPDGDYTVRLTGLELAGIRPATTAFDPEFRAVTIGGGEPPVLDFAAVGLFTQVLPEVTCNGSPAPDVGVRVVGGAVDTVVMTNALGKVVASVDPGHYTLFATDGPCPLSPAFQVVEVEPGQTVRVPFVGSS